MHQLMNLVAMTGLLGIPPRLRAGSCPTRILLILRNGGIRTLRIAPRSACHRGELLADCFAGIRGHNAEENWRLMEPGVVEGALQTASAIGDDRLQRRTQSYVVPDAFTHRSSEQRARWLMTGRKTGQVASCDTFQSSWAPSSCLPFGDSSQIAAEQFDGTALEDNSFSAP